MRHPFATVVAFMLLIAIVVISIYNNKSWFMKDEHATNQREISTSSTNEALVPVLIPKTKSVLNVGTTSNKKKEEPVQLERKTILLGCAALALIPIAILGFKLVGHAAKTATPARHIRSTFTRLIGSQQIFTVLGVFMIFLLLISIPVFKFRHPGEPSQQDPSVGKSPSHQGSPQSGHPGEPSRQDPSVGKSPSHQGSPQSGHPGEPSRQDPSVGKSPSHQGSSQSGHPGEPSQQDPSVGKSPSHQGSPQSGHPGEPSRQDPSVGKSPSHQGSPQSGHPREPSQQDPSVWISPSPPEERLLQRMYSILRQYNNTHYKELCDRVDELVNDGTIVETQKKNLLKLLQILHERILFVVSTIDAITKFSTRSGSLDNDLLWKIHVLGICDLQDLAYLNWNKFGLSESAYTALFGNNTFLQALLTILGYKDFLVHTFSDHFYERPKLVFDEKWSLLLYNRSLDSLLIHKEHLMDLNGNHVNVTELETDLALVKQASLNIFTSGLNTSVSTIWAQQKPQELDDAFNRLTSVLLDYKNALCFGFRLESRNQKDSLTLDIRECARFDVLSQTLEINIHQTTKFTSPIDSFSKLLLSGSSRFIVSNYADKVRQHLDGPNV